VAPDTYSHGEDNRRLTLEKEAEMVGEIDQQLIDLKEFTFDGDTGRALSDLYEAVNTIGGSKDSPFMQPFRLEGHERPAVVNSYLDPEGGRFHVVWYSDTSGLSHVGDVIFDAPSLEKEKTEDSCDSCGDGIIGIMEQLKNDS
jgi:hypothetical protein